MDRAWPADHGAGRAHEGLELPLIVRAAAVALLFAASGALGACGPSESNPIAIGKTAPQYATQLLNGDSVSLAGLKGKVVLLNVWATWCHPCRDEIPQLEALHQKHRSAGLEIVGVSIDAAGTEEGIRTFIRDFKMTYPVWFDPDERVTAQFLTVGVPETFLIDRAGVIRWRKIGPIAAGDSSLAAAIERALGG
jgi:cytochrome c biogenesis protein CcmG/thiol:disulfide interchange protein DsbE